MHIDLPSGLSPAELVPAINEALRRIGTVQASSAPLAARGNLSIVATADVGVTHIGVAIPGTALATSEFKGDHLSIKAFGAVGDGVTDDSVAIQAALDWAGAHGGYLEVPYGTYCHSATLNMRSCGLFGQFGQNRIRYMGSGTAWNIHNGGFTLHGLIIASEMGPYRALGPSGTCNTAWNGTFTVVTPTSGAFDTSMMQLDFVFINFTGTPTGQVNRATIDHYDRLTGRLYLYQNLGTLTGVNWQSGNPDGAKIGWDVKTCSEWFITDCYCGTGAHGFETGTRLIESGLGFIRGTTFGSCTVGLNFESGSYGNSSNVLQGLQFFNCRRAGILLYGALQLYAHGVYFEQCGAHVMIDNSIEGRTLDGGVSFPLASAVDCFFEKMTCQAIDQTSFVQRALVMKGGSTSNTMIVENFHFDDNVVTSGPAPVAFLSGASWIAGVGVDELGFPIPGVVTYSVTNTLHAGDLISVVNSGSAYDVFDAVVVEATGSQFQIAMLANPGTYPGGGALYHAIDYPISLTIDGSNCLTADFHFRDTSVGGAAVAGIYAEAGVKITAQNSKAWRASIDQTAGEVKLLDGGATVVGLDFELAAPNYVSLCGGGLKIGGVGEHDLLVADTAAAAGNRQFRLRKQDKVTYLEAVTLASGFCTTDGVTVTAWPGGDAFDSSMLGTGSTPVGYDYLIINGVAYTIDHDVDATTLILTGVSFLSGPANPGKKYGASWSFGKIRKVFAGLFHDTGNVCIGNPDPALMFPAWSGGTTYPAFVSAAYLGEAWLSLVNGNTGNQPNISPTWWQKEDRIPIDDGVHPTQLQGPVGVIGDIVVSRDSAVARDEHVYRNLAVDGNLVVLGTLTGGAAPPVSSVNGHVGVVVVTAADVGTDTPPAIASPHTGGGTIALAKLTLTGAQGWIAVSAGGRIYAWLDPT